MDTIWNWFINQPSLSNMFWFLIIISFGYAFVRAFDKAEEDAKPHINDQVPPEIRGNPAEIQRWLDSRPIPPGDNNAAAACDRKPD